MVKLQTTQFVPAGMNVRLHMEITGASAVKLIAMALEGSHGMESCLWDGMERHAWKLVILLSLALISPALLIRSSVFALPVVWDGPSLQQQATRHMGRWDLILTLEASLLPLALCPDLLSSGQRMDFMS